MFDVEEPTDIKEIKMQIYEAARQAFLKRKRSSLKDVIEKRIKKLEASRVISPKQSRNHITFSIYPSLHW